MLQILENAYLAILRFVVLAVAGLMLVAVVWFGIDALHLMKSEPAPVRVEPKVTAQEMISLATSPAPAAASTADNEAAPQGKPGADPLTAYYRRGADAIIRFGEKASHGQISADREPLVSVLKEQSADLKDPHYEAAYVKGLAETLEQTLSSPAVLKTASPEEPFRVVDKVLDGYKERFNGQIETVEAKNAEAQQKYLGEKAESQMSLYYAAAAFGAFLLIVFLSITIKIERNLRLLENLPRPEKAAPQAKTSRPAEAQA